MDKIYSRNRVKLPKLAGFKYNKRKIKKMYYFLIIWVIAIFTVVSISRYVTPVFEKICLEETKKIGTKILNIESTEVLKDVDYNDLVLVTKDKEDNISMVKSNVILINILASDIAYKIQEDLENLEKENIAIPMGTIFGSKILSGFGPDIKIKIVPMGNVITNFQSEFQSAGINQTIHKLYLIVSCEVSILTPYHTLDTVIENQVLFAENIIVGEIPDSYYNLEGLNSIDALEVVN